MGANRIGDLVKNLWLHGPNHGSCIAQKSAGLGMGCYAKFGLQAFASCIKWLHDVNVRGLKALLHHPPNDRAGHVAAAYKCNALSHVVSDTCGPPSKPGGKVPILAVTSSRNLQDRCDILVGLLKNLLPNAETGGTIAGFA